MAGLTKKDLKETFAGALEPFAQAVQGDVTRLDTKIGVEGMRIDNRLAKLELEVRETRHDVQKVKADVKWMKDNFSELFAKLDEFISLYKKQEQELAILAVQIKRLDERLSKLEAQQK